MAVCSMRLLTVVPPGFLCIFGQMPTGTCYPRMCGRSIVVGFWCGSLLELFRANPAFQVLIYSSQVIRCARWFRFWLFRLLGMWSLMPAFTLVRFFLIWRLLWLHHVTVSFWVCCRSVVASIQ
uniref:Uncharacterized protein n=1 Tax=Ciona intestinalis TaxID=7719 RepID=F6SAE2_CIOIN